MKVDPLMERTGTGSFRDYNGMFYTRGNEVQEGTHDDQSTR